MKKLLMLMIVVGISGQAVASVQFEIGANGASGNHWALGSGWGTQLGQLDAVFNVSPTLPDVSFALDVGQSYCFNFGTVQLRETDISFDETNNLGVTAYLKFDSPIVGTEGIPGDAIAFTGWVSDWATDLKITFDPVYVCIDQCGTFKVDLGELCFDKCETLCVDACVTLCSEPCPVIPEPATAIVWLLGAMSAVGLGIWRRKSRT